MKKHPFFIAVDSDGCVFDTMEIKHKECFCPATIKHFNLQAASKYAREAWEFVNLYSRQRGTNRFPALVSVLDLLRERPAVLARGVAIDKVRALRAWIASESKLGNPALKAAARGNTALQRVWAWSEEINARIEDIVYGVPPFPMVTECLKRARQAADVMVSSGTPLGALEREWNEHGLDSMVQRIAGQEDGTKTQHLTASASGKYATDCMLMIGDAPGDLAAARNVNALFYPIIPGQEEASWQALYDEGLERFFAGRFAGAYQASRIQALEYALPSAPPWL